jgi:transcriptional regulator with XRE-family HTH domain
MNRIKELREAKDMEQKALAIDIGVSQPTISDWETGRKTPSSKSAEKLADYFGVSIDYLLGRETEGAGANDELNEYLEELKNRKEMRMLFNLAKGATKEDVEKAVKIIEALKE